MTDAPTAYPLAWPPGYPRTPSSQRKVSRFTSGAESTFGRRSTRAITVSEAMKRVQSELDRIGARLPVVSSNMETRLDGLPRAGQREPADPGIALYFQLRGKPMVMPCDRYTTVAGNLAAIAAHIAATRAIERHGVGTTEQMFAGFQAIRGPDPKPWREVLGFPANAKLTSGEIMAKRRELAWQHHPDAGGIGASMADINNAAERGLKECE